MLKYSGIFNFAVLHCIRYVKG